MPHKRAKRSVREADRFSKGHNNPPSGTSSKDGFFGGLPKGAMRVLMGAQARADYQERKRAAGDAKRIGGGKTGDSTGTGVAIPSPDVKGKGKAVKKALATAYDSNSSKKEGAKHELKLLPGETLGNFNRRVEKTLAADITATLRAAASTSEKKNNKKRKASALDEEEDAETAKEKSAEKAAARAALEPTSQDLKKAREALVQNQQRRKHSGPEPGAEPIKDWAKVDQRRRINDIAIAPPKFTKVPKARGNPDAPSKPAFSSAATSLRDAFEIEAPAGAALDSDDDRDDNPKRKKSKGGNLARAVSRSCGSKKSSSSSSSARPPAVAPVREQALQKERQDAIERYRALKEARLQQRNEAKASAAVG
ncbi:unnamed protein product [Tilletia controversa]|uniref:Uncharacterized protein n=3 Tax=Tilletia TaxID=13289 RepID=A0A8X7SZ32_9BASI|nr:hypothetical protein CF336_g1765 [Tilletia laevis]KAE8203326.1 hypothetical protein CF328_g1723 [Tilletia controversa]KAE8263974.1 hypothetical protein A4X03_0g1287 [Tilletia caries]KAE8252425.1 hypothetical protein A4X06_0g2190 [Tilletia controversa]CAD6888080.1 unnamed protein product [Tilletia caries]